LKRYQRTGKLTPPAPCGSQKPALGSFLLRGLVQWPRKLGQRMHTPGIVLSSCPPSCSPDRDRLRRGGCVASKRDSLIDLQSSFFGIRLEASLHRMLYPIQIDALHFD
jgi:hypothetical protein